MYSPSRISIAVGGTWKCLIAERRENENTMESSHRASRCGVSTGGSDSRKANPAKEVLFPSTMFGMGMWLIIGSEVVSPVTWERGTDARRKAGGIVEGMGFRVRGAVVITEGRASSWRSSAVREMISVSCHASGIPIAGPVSPRRPKFFRIIAKSTGEGGDDWKKPSGSSPRETTVGSFSGISPYELFRVRKVCGRVWLPLPVMKKGGLANERAVREKRARSIAVPGIKIHARNAATAQGMRT